MAGCGCEVIFDGASSAYRQVLWLVIAINATMFLVEMAGGLAADSMALQADALDFLGEPEHRVLWSRRQRRPSRAV